MKKVISCILAATAAMSFTATSFATTSITWSKMGKSSTINSDLTTVCWHSNAKNYGTLASGVWSRLQEFTSGIGRMTVDGKATMYDVASSEVVTPANDRLQIRCGWNETDGTTVWYGGGTRIKLSDKELKPGTQYEITVKAGTKENTGVMKDGTSLYASFLSANGTTDFRSSGVTILKEYDSDVEKGAAGEFGILATDKYTDSEGNSYDKLNTYTLNVIPNSSDYYYDNVYSGFTTLVLFAANRAEDGTWNPIMDTGKMSELVIDSVSIEPVGNETASAVVKRGVSQTFEKFDSAQDKMVGDKMSWALNSDATKSRMNLRTTQKKVIGDVSTAAINSTQNMFVANKTGKDGGTPKAIDASIAREFYSYELRPGEKYGLSFYASVSAKDQTLPIKVQVGDSVVKEFNDSDNVFGAATYGWKQFYCTFTAPAADAYTEGKIKVVITAVGLPGISNGEVDFYIDDVVLTAAKQSFNADFNAAEGEDVVSFYSNVYAGNEAINAKLYPVVYNADRLVDLDTLRDFVVDANSVTTLTDSVPVTGGDTMKLLYWDDMTPIADFDLFVKSAQQ